MKIGVLELDPAIELTGGLVRQQEPGFAVTLGGEPVRIDPMLRDQVLPRGLGPPLRQSLIVFGASDTIGMAGNDDGIFRDARVLQRRRNLVELAACLCRQLDRVEFKVDGAVEGAGGAHAGRRGDAAQPAIKERHAAFGIERADHFIVAQLLCEGWCCADCQGKAAEQQVRAFCGRPRLVGLAGASWKGNGALGHRGLRGAR